MSVIMRFQCTYKTMYTVNTPDMAMEDEIQFNSEIILIPPSLIENPLREGSHS